MSFRQTFFSNIECQNGAEGRLFRLTDDQCLNSCDKLRMSVE